MIHSPSSSTYVRIDKISTSGYDLNLTGPEGISIDLIKQGERKYRMVNEGSNLLVDSSYSGDGTE
nr:hypothetical protein [Bacillus sp. mrc49]